MTDDAQLREAVERLLAKYEHEVEAHEMGAVKMGLAEFAESVIMEGIYADVVSDLRRLLKGEAQ